MNRRSFLQALGLGVAAVSLSPMLDLAPIVAAPSVPYAEVTFWGLPALVDDGTYRNTYLGIDRSSYPK